MSDFDTLLREVLNDGADHAPAPAGLAGRARVRAQSRRRTRAGLAAAAVVLAVAVPIGTGALGGTDDEQTATDPGPTPSPTATTDGTFTVVRQAGVTVAIPRAWTAAECGQPIVNYDASGACSFDGPGLFFLRSATFDPRYGPGVIAASDESGDRLWGGYVYGGTDWAILVQTPSRDLTRNLLARVRLDGQPDVDGSAWEDFSRDGISWQFPAHWGLGDGADLTGYGVCASDVAGNGPVPSPVESQLDAEHYRIEQQVDGHLVTVVAPTRAVADLVLATVANAPDAPHGGCGLS